jgi:YD repeat-containing protein
MWIVGSRASAVSGVSARAIALLLLLVSACSMSERAHAQSAAHPCHSYKDPNSYVSDCETEGTANARANADAASYLAAYPKDAWGTANQLCAAIKGSANGPYVWVAGVPSIYAVCTQQGGGYTNPVFRGRFPEANTCSAQPTKLSAQGATGAQCLAGCEYNFTSNGDGSSTGTPSGAVCAVPAFDPGKNNDCCEYEGSPVGPVGAGNPINMFAGNKVETETDYRDPNGHLNFVRHYSSMEIPLNLGSVLGSRWRHGYQLSVGAAPISYDKNLNRASGNTYTYRQSGSSWLPDKDVSERLSAVMNGTQLAGWRAVTLNSVTEVYNASGRLTQIEYPDGDILQAAYDTQGRLSSVTDRRGRALAFTYASSLLDSVTLPDGVVIKYGYGTLQRLTSVSHHANAASPPLSSIQYAYEDLNDPKLLSGIVDESGERYATWSYDVRGRGISSHHGTEC